MGRDIAEPTKKGLFRKNDLDEMTVGRTEKPVTGALPEKPEAAKGTKRFSPLLGEERSGESRSNRSSESIAETNARSASEGPARQPERDDVRPVVRGKTGVGSYEDPGEQKRKGRTKGKTGRPGR